MGGSSGRITFRFGEFEVDTAAYELRRHGRRIRLARQPMELLLLLLERPRELVSRDDIATRLWGRDVFGDLDAGTRSAVLKIRQALGDSHHAPRFLETVAGKGYRFIAPVDVTFPAAARTLIDQSHSSGDPPLRRRHNLPSELTSFVGRHMELQELHRLLGGSRLLSLTGAAGVGKTRLATQLVSGCVKDCSDGVWLVDLAPLTAPGLIGQEIATALGVRESAQRPVRAALVEWLRDRQLLLLLDTCEHLIDDCAELAEALLREAPGLRIVATSREALGVPGEVVYRVPSLAMPPLTPLLSADALLACEATRLFVERATAVDHHFKSDAGEADSIARICRRLDGIPLAIELAAAHVAVLSPAQIEALLLDQFRVLTGGTRTAVARQRTLEATMDWSYKLLSDVERTLLSRLSVFPASWTLDAAEHVCWEDSIERPRMLDHLSRLVNKSLVMVELDATGGRRYRFLETVRQYARERLAQAGATEQLRDRHFEFFFHEFRGMLPILRHDGQAAALKRLRIEQENVRAALEWAVTSQLHAEDGLELAGALFWFWAKRGLFEEGRIWLKRALAGTGHGAPLLRARALIGLAHMHYFQGHAFDLPIGEALSAGRQAGDAWTVSFALFMQSLGALECGEHERAMMRAIEAREAADAGGDLVQQCGPLMILASIAIERGDQDEAHRLYDQSIAVARNTGDTWSLGILLALSAGLSIFRGNVVEASARATEAMSLCQELEDPRGLAWSLEVFAGLMAARGYQDAARLWGAVDALLDSVGGVLTPTIAWIRNRYYEPMKLSLGDTFEQARIEGRAMAPEQAIICARQHALLAGLG